MSTGPVNVIVYSIIEKRTFIKTEYRVCGAWCLAQTFRTTGKQEDNSVHFAVGSLSYNAVWACGRMYQRFRGTQCFHFRESSGRWREYVRPSEAGREAGQ
jgi:hypothetical protein